MNIKDRRSDNFKALHSLFEHIDSVLPKTESFIHTLDFGKDVSDPEETGLGKEIITVLERYNTIFIRNRNRLADKLNDIVGKIE